MLEQLNTQIDEEAEIARQLQAERARLRREAGLVQLRPFQRPTENTFTAEERDKVIRQVQCRVCVRQPVEEGDDH